MLDKHLGHHLEVHRDGHKDKESAQSTGPRSSTWTAIVHDILIWSYLKLQSYHPKNISTWWTCYLFIFKTIPSPPPGTTVK